MIGTQLAYEGTVEWLVRCGDETKRDVYGVRNVRGIAKRRRIYPDEAIPKVLAHIVDDGKGQERGRLLDGAECMWQ